MDWVSTHRYHHQHCDTDRDPHSPKEGFWFSHISWLFDTRSIITRVQMLSSPLLHFHVSNFYRIYGFVMDLLCGMVMQCGEANNVGDMERQAFYRFMRTTYILHPIALALVLYALGGFPFLVWGMVS